MCGVFGVYAPERDVARLSYFGLFALQHRGQESAGIAVSEAGRLTALRDLGLVTQVFDEQKLHGLQGQVAIGHTRYSTTGSSQWSNAQRLDGAYSTVALSNATLIAFRDPHGFRPLVLGQIHGDWVVASETCALDLVGAQFVREVERGEAVLIDGDGLRSVRAVEPNDAGALCVFEFFYLARPDTRLAGV